MSELPIATKLAPNCCCDSLKVVVVKKEVKNLCRADPGRNACCSSSTHVLCEVQSEDNPPHDACCCNALAFESFSTQRAVSPEGVGEFPALVPHAPCEGDEESGTAALLGRDASAGADDAARRALGHDCCVREVHVARPCASLPPTRAGAGAGPGLAEHAHAGGECCDGNRHILCAGHDSGDEDAEDPAQGGKHDMHGCCCGDVHMVCKTAAVTATASMGAPACTCPTDTAAASAAGAGVDPPSCAAGEAPHTNASLRLILANMCCALEADMARKALDTLPGVRKVDVRPVGRLCVVSYCERECSPNAILTALRGAHLAPRVTANGEENGEQEAATPRERAERAVLLVAGALLVVGGLAMLASGEEAHGGGEDPTLRELWTGRPWHAYVLLASAVLGLVPVLPRVATAVRLRQLSTPVLMAIAAAGAIFAADWGEGALVVVLFAAAEVAQGWALGRVERGLAKSNSMLSPMARLPGGRRVPAETLETGAALELRGGDVAPTDAEVVSGAASMDEAVLTGEPRPQRKTRGDLVRAGSVCQVGFLRLRAVCAARDSSLGRLQQDVDATAALSGGRVSTLVDRFVRVYTPVAVLLAFGVAVVGPLATGASSGAHWWTWVRRGLVILIASCPCALVMSAPVPIACTLAKLMRRGVLVRSAVGLEALSNLRRLYVDKTGTLTMGQFEVCAAEPVKGATMGVDEAVRLAGAVEAASSHPLAAAVVLHAVGCVADAVQSDALSDMQCEQFSAHDGVGVRGVVGSHVVAVGGERLLKGHEGAGGVSAPVALAPAPMSASKGGCCSHNAEHDAPPVSSRACEDPECESACCVEGSCAEEAVRAESSCCSSKAPAAAEEEKDESSCCSSKAPAKAEGSCCSSKAPAAAEEEKAEGSCCSSKAPAAAEEEKAESSCCSSKAPAKAEGSCCSSKAPAKAEGSCCSSKAPAAAEEEKAEGSCCSSKAPAAAEEEKAESSCCSSKAPAVAEEEKAESSCCSSKAPAKAEGSCCSSKAPAVAEEEKAESSCCSSKAPAAAEEEKAESSCCSSKAPVATVAACADGCCAPKPTVVNDCADGCCAPKAPSAVLSAEEVLAAQAALGRSALVVVVDGVAQCVLALEDGVRSESAGAVAALQAEGVAVHMLTGDHHDVAHAVGKRLGLDSVRARLMPSEKHVVVREARRELRGEAGAQHEDADVEADVGTGAHEGTTTACGKPFSCVGMVGDGVNDGPALAEADVGVAMGAGGMALAVRAANVVLLSDDLSLLPRAVHDARAGRRTVVQNVALSIGIKMATVSAALAGYAPLWVAVLADVGAVLLVVANGMRTLQ